MSPTTADTHEVTIAGGGIAALETTLALRDLAPDVHLELLAPATHADYRPLAVLEPFALGEMPRLDLAAFASEQRAVLRHDTLVAVEPDAHVIVTGSGERLPYDILVVAAGAQAVEAIPGALTFRGHTDQRQVGLLVEEYAAARLKRLRIRDSCRRGLELAGIRACADDAGQPRRTRRIGRRASDRHSEARPLTIFGTHASRDVAELLDRAGIGVRTGAAPSDSSAGC